MRFRRLHLLPVSVFLIIIGTFVITYAIAVWLDHVEPVFPYISDSGAVAPESCIFAQFINIAAGLLLACMYVRYLQIKEFLQRPAERPALSGRLNCVAAIFGAVSCVGLDLVGNFQETTVVSVHLTGAFLCFFTAIIYFCLQTYISRKMMPEVTTFRVYLSRLVISTLSIVFTICSIASGILSVRRFKGDDIKKWRPKDGGWELHLVSAISEWLMVICFCGFIVTFSTEFRGLELEGPSLRVPIPK